MKRKPIIGITLDLVEADSQYSYSNLPWYAIRKNYADAIFKEGGIPLMIPYEIASVAEISELIDGLIIPGSDADINPKFYGVDLISNYTQFQHDDNKTQFELALLSKILSQNKPYLGICHGMQLLNILFQGTLIQHIPDEIESNIEHKNSNNHAKKIHTIDITHNTILSQIYKLDTIEVNSNHHQAIDDLGSGLIISAVAPDGIIEAIELKNSKFTVGVQWHPEYLDDETDLVLFTEFIAATSAVAK